jgi:ribosomal protein S19E (S16A)
MTNELAALIEIERNGLSAMLMLTATSRETAPEAETDPRYVRAAHLCRRRAHHLLAGHGYACAKGALTSTTADL